MSDSKPILELINRRCDKLEELLRTNREETAGLKVRVDRLESGPMKWLQTIAMVVGIVGGLMGITSSTRQKEPPTKKESPHVRVRQESPESPVPQRRGRHR